MRPSGAYRPNGKFYDPGAGTTGNEHTEVAATARTANPSAGTWPRPDEVCHFVMP